MKQYEAYLFDMDGTVVETFEPWIQIAQETLHKYGITLDDKVVVKKIFGAAETGLTELGVPEADLANIFKTWDTKAAEMMRHVVLYPGISDVLKTLNTDGKKCALITATARTTVEVILKKRQIAELFDVVVTGNDMDWPKPDPGGLLYALNELKVDASRAVMLGDSEKDIGAAHNAGTDSILFYPPSHELFHNKAELLSYKPTYVVDSWSEFLQDVMP